MADTQKKPRPEGTLLEAGRKRAGNPSIRSIAPQAGLTEGRWRQIVKGWQSAGRGQMIEVVAPAETVARMASVVGVTPDELRAAGRDDAATFLDALLDALTPEFGTQVARFIGGRQLDPDLAGFTDNQLLAELEARLLYMAGKLEARSESAFAWRVDRDGDATLTTIPPRQK